MTKRKHKEEEVAATSPKRKRATSKRAHDTVANASKKKSQQTIPDSKRDGGKKETKQSPSPQSEEPKWSKSKKKRLRQLKAKLKKKKLMGGESVGSKRRESPVGKETGNSGAELAESADDKKSGSSKLQQSFRTRLSGSRFRVLNEELYTTTSTESFQRFSAKPELYEQYHEGFRSQVSQWPVNPVDVLVEWIKNNKLTKKKSKVVVADFGCGDAQLAKQLISEQEGRYRVHSFDLVACCDLVTACDMARVPISDQSVDVAIFCLSLMGTNLADFIREAHRVLKKNGRVKIAEVRSRFEQGTDDTKEFVRVLGDLGFECVDMDRSNKMFVLLELRKNGKTPKAKLKYTAKPCIYKRR